MCRSGKKILKLNKSAKLIFGTLEYLQKHLCRRNLLSCDLHYKAHKFDIVKGRLKIAKSNLPIVFFVHCAMLKFLPLMPLQKIGKSFLLNSTKVGLQIKPLLELR